MEQQRSQWFKWQRGQAMMEYWPTIPAAIIIMLAASLIVQFFTNTIITVVNDLQPEGGFDCEQEQDDKDEGPTYAELDCHSIELVGKSYDPETDRTTVAYRVTSKANPGVSGSNPDNPSGKCADISHWVLGFPPGLKDKVLSVSEGNYEWGTDPTTGLYGIKFDTGYGGGGGGSDSGGSGGGGNGGGKGGGGGKKSGYHATDMLRDLLFQESDSREVLLTLGGFYQWDTTPIAVKAGTGVYYNYITAPALPVDENDQQNQCEQQK